MVPTTSDTGGAPERSSLHVQHAQQNEQRDEGSGKDSRSPLLA